ncbi:MAG: outer membrane protein transport protein [Ignavibacteriales bacterium]|nr:outer membrane protein transport protein [Ignavibacteriales bacterium]
MKSSLAKKIDTIVIAALLNCASIAIAQPSAVPLDVQGLDQWTIAGVRSRAMGGASVASANDASALFSNPAALSRLSSFEIRAGGLYGRTSRQQTQAWVPMRPVPGLSLLLESLTGTVKTPDSLGIPGLPVSAWETVQRQYDNITPNWDRSTSASQPLSLAAAMPLEIAGFKIAAGVGASQVMNLDNFYQDNNALSPYPGQLRPFPVFFTNRNDTVHIKWYQYIRERKGFVYGITPGAAITLLPGLTLGGSVTILSGTSDDNESRVERGHINVAISNGVAGKFMVDTVYYFQTKIGTSTYSGNVFTLGLRYEQERFSVGAVVKPAMTLTRKWDRNVTSLDTTKKWFPIRIDSLTARNYKESGSDKLEFPLSYTLGFILTPTDKWTIAFDYEVRSLGDMQLTSTSAAAALHPWINNRATMRFGVEYCADDMLALRGGYRQDIQAFSPDGSAIIDEPARGGVYSLGAGFAMGNILIDVAYEYWRLKFDDVYQSNTNYNSREQHQFMMEIAYRF